MTDIIDFHKWKNDKVIKSEDYYLGWKSLPIKNIELDNDFIIIRTSNNENNLWCANYNVISDKTIIEELNCKNNLHIQWITMREIEKIISTFENPNIG